MNEPPRTFVEYTLDHGVLADLEDDPFPSRLLAWRDAELDLAGDATHFGFVASGAPKLECASGSFTLRPGMFFSAAGPAAVTGGGSGIVVDRVGHRGWFQLGGPVEERGRLRYIDGCTDSLLLPPLVKGDPCLNLLHIPARTQQSAHTHPSLRLGMILDGAGLCVTPDGRIPLRPGQVFLIRTGGLHSFHTESSHLRVLAYHPDSDFGPTHEDHPMLNRTHLARETT